MPLYSRVSEICLTPLENPPGISPVKVFFANTSPPDVPLHSERLRYFHQFWANTQDRQAIPFVDRAHQGTLTKRVTYNAPYTGVPFTTDEEFPIKRYTNRESELMAAAAPVGAENPRMVVPRSVLTDQEHGGMSWYNQAGVKYYKVARYIDHGMQYPFNMFKFSTGKYGMWPAAEVNTSAVLHD